MTLLAFHPLQAAYLHHMISTAERLVQRLRPEAHYVIGTVYNDFDIISGQVSRHCSAPPHPIRGVCYALLGAQACRVLIGAWNPTL